MRATRVSLIARHLISSTITTPTTTTRSLVTAKVLVAISSPSFSTTWTPLIRTTAAKMAPPQLVLYTMNTPNGVKVSIALEELGLPYEIKNIDISTGIQKEPWYVLPSLPPFPYPSLPIHFFCFPPLIPPIVSYSWMGGGWGWK